VGDAGHSIKGLSGGERRRLAVAVELMGSPSIVLADEPTSGQDSSTALQVRVRPLMYVPPRAEWEST
jgi:ABC-type multidrug transport system ATPase subunit